MSERTFGTVKWFSRAKGYGFIQPDGSGEDVFVHYTAIVGEGFRNLKRGQRVQFNTEDTPKGPQAVEVSAVESTEESTAGVAQTPDMSTPESTGEALDTSTQGS
jgi:CspA family cold shock protein